MRGSEPMASSRPPTNLRLIRPSRARLRPGDVFAAMPGDLGYLFGRVVDTNTRIGGFPGGVILTYMYRPLLPSMDPPHDSVLDPHDLLIPPFGINRLPWSRGYFHVIDHRPLRQEDVLATHVFHDTVHRPSRYVDVHGRVVPKPNHAVAEFALQSYRTIDDIISRIVGLPLAQDE